MPLLHRYMAITLLAWTLSLFMGPVAHAHLMVAQQGTLNMVDEGVYMVLSLPISAFGGVDDNNDGRVSMVEFNNHRGTIIESVRQNVTLSDTQKTGHLRGILLSPVTPHDLTEGPISRLTVMGQFTLTDTADALLFNVGLYGTQAAEQVLEITATRTRHNQKAVFKLTPTASSKVIFSDSALPQHKPVAWHL
jgi:hypothetical protein